MVAVKCSLFFVSVSILCCESKVISGQQDSLLKFLSKSWKHCMDAPTLKLCFKQRSLLSLDNLVRSNDPIYLPGDTISLVKTKQEFDSSANVLTAADLQKHLPKDIQLQEKTLDMLLESAYAKFLSSRSLLIRLPHETQPQNLTSEERGKKKGNGAGAAAMIAACTMIPMALAGIGMLAGKALMTSLLALMLSALLATKKSHEGGGSSYEVISIPAGGGHHHHGRRLITADELAFDAYDPK